jgi:hypothetical protein
MEWTQENVIGFIELYKRKEIIWDPNNQMHFNKIKKQDTWEKLGKEINRPIDVCKKENGELTVISPTKENEYEKKQWNRKR